MTGPDHRLRDWADQNLLASEELLARYPPAGTPAVAPRRFGSAIAYATGRSSGFFNAVVLVERADAGGAEAGVDWVRGLGLAASLRVRDDLDGPETAAAAARLGLQRETWADPAMVLHPIPAPPPRRADLEIVEAGPSTLDRFYVANAAGFGFPVEAAERMQSFTPPEIVDDPDVRLFGAYLDGRPVACSYAIRSGPVVGVYAVGTAEWARRRGIATAMTWQAISAGREWGCEAATLQASPMGEPVYRAMGFVEVARYVAYVEPRDANPPTITGVD